MLELRKWKTKKSTFLKNSHPGTRPMSFAAKKNKNEKYHLKGIRAEKKSTFLKNSLPGNGPMSFAAKKKKAIQIQDKQTPHTTLQKLSPKTVPWVLK